MKNQKGYVVISELPLDQQEPFKKWLINQTLPVIPEEGTNSHNCAYSWDYEHWFSHWSIGKEAEIDD
jgi:hypothetical protein